jgi:hypothetical protein
LVGFFEQLDQVPNDPTVAAIEEGSRETGVASTTSTTDAVNVVINVGRKVIVDDVSDVAIFLLATMNKGFVGCTYGISRPRAATAVATMIGHLPLR